MEPASEPAELIARTTPLESHAAEWALVLESAGIACRVEMLSGQWQVVVSTSASRRAVRMLDAYDREGAKPLLAVGDSLDYGRTYAGLVMAAGLGAFYCITGTRAAGSVWFRTGAAVASRILHGEWWRTVTALTLHADLSHIAGNVLFCALFGTALCTTVGPGVGAWLMLLSGAGGNALNAALRGAPYSAVGASTAIFGAVGSLGGLRFVNRSRLGVTRWRAWAPVAAALGLLAMVGTGRESDFLAHGFGFAVGALLGGGVAFALRRPLSSLVQTALGMSAFATVVLCWWMAIG